MFDGSTAGAARYVFDLVNSELQSTAIPSQTEPRSFDTHDASMALYKDAHVLKLKNDRGWLMLLGRYTTAENDKTVFGPGGDNPNDTNSSAAIVAYWCDSPTFAQDVKGPYFLVARYHDFVIGGATEQVPLWLGVPAACELEVDGAEWLYVYYTAELTIHANATEYDGQTTTPPDFVPGTHVKRIATALLPWGNAFGEAWYRTTGGFYQVAGTDETLWNSKSGLHEVAGEKLGKVNIYVATGYRWQAGEDPDTLGNRLIWDRYEDLKDVDAVPVVFDRGLALYFAGNHTKAAGPPVNGRRYGWGIWRGVLGPETAGRVYGTDFVVRAVADADPGGTDDLVARSNPTNTVGNWSGDSQTRLDPDPVRLPSGEWIVFSGSQSPSLPDGTPGPGFPLERFEGTAAAAEEPYREAWR